MLRSVVRQRRSLERGRCGMLRGVSGVWLATKAQRSVVTERCSGARFPTGAHGTVVTPECLGAPFNTKAHRNV
eukprot:2876067-Alexandrium_andersonii.AAC.1